MTTRAVAEILVPLDGSEAADRAIPFAARLAARVGARVHLVSVVRPVVAGTAGMLPGFAVMPTDLDSITRTALEKHLEERADDIELLYGVLVEHQVLDALDPVADQLVEYSATRHIDLIVMVTHGRSAIGRLCLGSVGTALLERAGIPCLLLRDRHGHVARRPARTFGFSRILVPVDGTQESEAAIDQAVALATPGITEIRLLVVVPEHWLPNPRREYAVPESVQLANAEAYAQGLARRLAERGYQARGFTVAHTSPAGAIAECVEAQRIDLVSITSHHRSEPDRLMFGSVIDALVHATDVPVLAQRTSVAEIMSVAPESAACCVPASCSVGMSGALAVG